ncbi:MAG: sulfurtransferase [Gammaproteobacteria bacterium CG11_big_fil_rev_8_21_14_0_20_46_22]|nr:MAG: sulfurtransferase [Gammaproteobacteria bacterium CG12_big_fil_rev_8_21_14_0_65_46_12]PIR10606.1 MAG: sulfurtransferase [Gammaproteobacteria bacterium CG11_big_fil_rev_8_21_14_0_20_46_22]
MTTVQKISAETLRQLLAEHKDWELLDVREPDEYQAEHISGAISKPLNRCVQEGHSVEKPCVVYCRSGVRSEQAAKAIVQQCNQDADIYMLDGGIVAWKKAGGSTVKTTGFCFSVMRQVQIIIGFMVVLGVVLGLTLSPYYSLISGFFGLGLLFAGITGTCGLARLLMLLPFNR